MKLLRYGPAGKEKPAVLDPEGKIRDISRLISDLDPQSLAAVDIVSILRSADLRSLPVIEENVRTGPCVSRPGKVMCIGFNSRLHTQQMGHAPVADDPITVFLKPATAVSGPNDPILYSRHAGKLDWEAELGVVIGKKGKYIEPADAATHILGYTCFNDVSDRYWQFETGDKQYTKGKGFDSFAPVGPQIVTPDEVPNPSDLDVKFWVNGELRQDFNTSDYVLNAEEAVSYLSRFFTLCPGDIIAMGSGPGNAKSWGEDKFLKPGDRVTLEIESLGRQDQRVVKE
ncbi:MAG TPA: fumarylacetoacetate hydrolase family protein [Candidatus Omnitrophota bacterium]|nr:fumarylacetoacetate hydrolase family protein [Candidatus Omnitrophota bacterium]HPS36625.1 fumarylacetoacetate hydrolase family protein [Candidatus Omnitrophota bacterium]